MSSPASLNSIYNGPNVLLILIGLPFSMLVVKFPLGMFTLFLVQKAFLLVFKKKKKIKSIFNMIDLRCI